MRVTNIAQAKLQELYIRNGVFIDEYYNLVQHEVSLATNRSVQCCICAVKQHDVMLPTLNWSWHI
jgi:hypothetical protein